MVLKWSLKALRVNAGLTAKEVADIVGIHQQTLLKYERDSMDIRVDLLAQLAELYHVSQDDIFLGKQSVLKRKFVQNQQKPGIGNRPDYQNYRKMVALLFVAGIDKKSWYCQILANNPHFRHEHDEHFPPRCPEILRRRTGQPTWLRNEQRVRARVDPQGSGSPATP